jgi:hypothetical protein
VTKPPEWETIRLYCMVLLAGDVLGALMINNEGLARVAAFLAGATLTMVFLISTAVIPMRDKVLRMQREYAETRRQLNVLWENRTPGIVPQEEGKHD